MAKVDLALLALAVSLGGGLAYPHLRSSASAPTIVVPPIVAAVEATPVSRFAMHIAFMGEDPADLAFCYSGRPRSGCPDFLGEPGFDQASHAFISADACEEAAKAAVIVAAGRRFYRYACAPTKP